MKIAVVGKKNYLYWDSHVVSALKEMGHEVYHFQINERPLSINMSRTVMKVFSGKKKARSLSDQWHANILLNKLNEFSPELIIYVSSFFIPLEYYDILQDVTSKPILFGWDGDGGAANPMNHMYSKYFDVMYETEKLYCDKNELGFKKMVHLPFCINPAIHKNFNRSREDKIYFCGAWSEERDEIITSLSDFPVVLKGWGWKNLSKIGKKFEIYNGTVDIYDQVKDYNKYSIVLNKHQAINHVNALNMRTFEAAGCGALVLHDDRQELESVYANNEEMIVYSRDNLHLQAEKIFSNNSYMSSIAKAGEKRTLNEHTYLHRLHQMLKEYDMIKASSRS